MTPLSVLPPGAFVGILIGVGAVLSFVGWFIVIRRRNH